MSKPVIKSAYAASGAAASEAKIGGTIPENMVRYILGMVISSTAAETLVIYNGTVGGTLTTGTLATIDVADNSGVAQALVVGTFDPDKPVLVVRPQKAAGGAITLNGVYLKHGSTAVNVTMTYCDVPA